MQNWSWTKSVQKSNKNQFWEGLGLYLGGVRARLGPPLGAFGRLPEDKKTTFWEDKCFLPTKWAPKGLLDGFGVALGGF